MRSTVQESYSQILVRLTGPSQHGGAVEAFPDERAGADDQGGSESGAWLASWSAIWRRSRAFVPPLRTVTVFPAA